MNLTSLYQAFWVIIILIISANIEGVISFFIAYKIKVGPFDETKSWITSSESGDTKIGILTYLLVFATLSLAILLIAVHPKMRRAFQQARENERLRRKDFAEPKAEF